jgi:hypothetical protein
VRQGAKRLFRKYDRDGDAKLDVGEIKGMLLGLGKEISIHDIKKYISMGRGFGLHKNTKKRDSILDVPFHEPKKKGDEHKHVQRTDSGGAGNSPEDKKSPRYRASPVTADAALEHTPDSARSGGRVEAGRESEGVGGVVGRSESLETKGTKERKTEEREEKRGQGNYVCVCERAVMHEFLSFPHKIFCMYDAYMEQGAAGCSR